MPVPCARCTMPLPTAQLERDGAATCTFCRKRNHATIFPAALVSRGEARAEIAAEGEGTCYDHAEKRAVGACQQCGRFVCQLCAVEFGSGVWCPSCVAGLATKPKSARGDTARNLYDTWALATPFLTLLVWPFTILSGPAVVALAVMKWGAPLSLVRRSRWRFVVGLLAGCAEGVAWIWGLWYLVAKIKSAGV